MTDGLASARFALPLLAAGQAQKETWHNEALALIDMLLLCAVEGRADAPPPEPAEGACWIVGPVPDGDWTGRAGQLAGWSGAGWRFVSPRAGLVVGDAGGGAAWRCDGAGWTRVVLAGDGLAIGGQQVVGARRAAIAPPVGGGTVDGEARAAIAAILAALAGHGLIGAS